MALLSTPSLAHQLRGLSFHLLHRGVASVASEVPPNDSQSQDWLHTPIHPIRGSPGEGRRAEPRPHAGAGLSFLSRKLRNTFSEYSLL